MNGFDVTTIYTEYLDNKPAKGLWVREREVLGKKQDYSYLYLADQGFDVTFRGARPLPDENWDRYARTTKNDILYLLRFRRDDKLPENCARIPGACPETAGLGPLFGHIELERVPAKQKVTA